MTPEQKAKLKELLHDHIMVVSDAAIEIAVNQDSRADPDTEAKFMATRSALIDFIDKEL